MTIDYEDFGYESDYDDLNQALESILMAMPVKDLIYMILEDRTDWLVENYADEIKEYFSEIAYENHENCIAEEKEINFLRNKNRI